MVVVGRSNRPWEGLSRGEKLSRAADLALDCAKQILELGIDPSDVKTLAIVKDTALTIISQQIRLEERHPGQMPPDGEPRKIEVVFVGPNSAEHAEPALVELPMIASQAAYDALPSGSHFIAPDGEPMPMRSNGNLWQSDAEHWQSRD